MTAVVLRDAGLPDVAALAALAGDSFAATYRRTHDPNRIRIHCEHVLGVDAVRGWLEDPGQRVLLAVNGSELLAFAQWHVAAAPQPAQRAIEIKRFYVAASAHGSGLARRLFDAVRSAAVEAGADLLWLCVYPGNDRALRFYARQGLTPIGHVPYTFVDQTEDDLALGLRLASPP